MRRAAARVAAWESGKVMWRGGGHGNLSIAALCGYTTVLGVRSARLKWQTKRLIAGYRRLPSSVGQPSGVFRLPKDRVLSPGGGLLRAPLVHTTGTAVPRHASVALLGLKLLAALLHAIRWWLGRLAQRAPQQRPWRRDEEVPPVDEESVESPLLEARRPTGGSSWSGGFLGAVSVAALLLVVLAVFQGSTRPGAVSSKAEAPTEDWFDSGPSRGGSTPPGIDAASEKASEGGVAAADQATLAGEAAAKKAKSYGFSKKTAAKLASIAATQAGLAAGMPPAAAKTAGMLASQALTTDPTPPPEPIPARIGCRTAVAPYEADCVGDINWIKTTGINQHPDWYPGLTAQSPAGDIQSAAFKSHHTKCSVKGCTGDKECLPNDCGCMDDAVNFYNTWISKQPAMAGTCQERATHTAAWEGFPGTPNKLHEKPAC
eukprot:g30181.t2